MVTDGAIRDAALAEAEAVAAEQVRRYEVKKAVAWGEDAMERWERMENYRDAAQYIVDGIRALRGLQPTEG